MSQNVVLLRADASPLIGFGHVSRCLAVAEALRAGGSDAVFVTRTAACLPFLEREGWRAHVLPGGNGKNLATLPASEAEELLRVAEAHGASWIVVDHYGAGGPYFRALGGRGFRIARIDDLPGRPIDGIDLIVNASPGLPGDAYPATDDHIALLGPSFALLRAAFRELKGAALARAEGELRRVIVLLGGADIAGWMEPVLVRLDEALLDSVEIVAVCGPAGARPPRQGAHRGSSRIHRVGPVSPAVLARTMSASQAAVATASTVCWELAVVGVPMAVLPVADNQEPIARELEHVGAAIVLSRPDQVGSAFSPEDGLASGAVRRRLARAAAGLTDGLGAIRVAEHLR